MYTYRGTTVYLADRRFDMLPSVLSERVCSLRHKVDRYAVSVIWTLDKNMNIVDTWFGRTVINSSCEMEYDQAQQFLDGNTTAAGLGKNPEVYFFLPSKLMVRGVDNALCKKLKPSVLKLAEVLRVIRVKKEEKESLIHKNV